MATKSTKRNARKKAQTPRVEAPDLKPTKDPKGGLGLVKKTFDLKTVKGG